jgi:hypothetical protein
MSEKPEGPSLLLMFSLLGIAILLALAIAYTMISPYFHHR